MKTNQIHDIEKLLDWLKSSPFEINISSLQGGSLHVKFILDKPFEDPYQEFIPQSQE